NLGGSFSTGVIGLGSATTFNRTGGTVNLTGSLNNAGATLTLNSITGNWFVNSSATVTNGTITTTAGNTLTVNGTATFDGVILTGPTAIAVASSLTLKNNTELDTTLAVSGVLAFNAASGTQQLTTTSAG